MPRDRPAPWRTRPSPRRATPTCATPPRIRPAPARTVKHSTILPPCHSALGEAPKDEAGRIPAGARLRALAVHKPLPRRPSIDAVKIAGHGPDDARAESPGAHLENAMMEHGG